MRDPGLRGQDLPGKDSYLHSESLLNTLEYFNCFPLIWAQNLEPKPVYWHRKPSRYATTLLDPNHLKPFKKLTFTEPLET